MHTHTIVDSPLGPLTLVADEGTLSGVFMDMADASAFGPRTDRGFEEVTAQLGEYFAGQRRDFTLSTRVAGSAFQRRVWQALTTIPYGQTWSYTQLAGAIGRPDRIRAVGGANARNPLAIVVPCHRVIGSDGSLTGYAGGLARKRFLLDHERSAAQRVLDQGRPGERLL